MSSPVLSYTSSTSHDDLPFSPAMSSLGFPNQQEDNNNNNMSSRFSKLPPQYCLDYAQEEDFEKKTDYFLEVEPQNDEEDIFFPESQPQQISTYYNNNYIVKQEQITSHNNLQEDYIFQQQQVKVEDNYYPQQNFQQQQYHFNLQVKQEESPLKKQYQYIPKQQQQKFRNPKNIVHSKKNATPDQEERLEYRKIKKNFLKNYCSAFLHHIQKAKETLGPVLIREGIDQNNFFSKYLPKRNKVNNQIMFKDLFSVSFTGENKTYQKQMYQAYQQVKQQNKVYLDEETLQMAQEFEQLLNEKKVLRKFALKFFREDVMQYCMFSARIKNVFQFLKLKYEFIQNLMNLNAIEQESSLEF